MCVKDYMIYVIQIFEAVLENLQFLNACTKKYLIKFFLVGGWVWDVF
jgi:hypothetical protein